MKPKKYLNRSRLPLAITLIAASFISAFALAALSNSKREYWVATLNLPVGHQISIGEMQLVSMNLDSSSTTYVEKSLNPLGQVVVRNLMIGQIVDQESISATVSVIASSAVPLSVRAVDLAEGIQVGEAVDIYWVLDSDSGQGIADPIFILGGVRVLSADTKSKNFGTDAAITVAVEETQVLRLLSATTKGRLVVIRSHV